MVTILLTGACWPAEEQGSRGRGSGRGACMFGNSRERILPKLGARLVTVPLAEARNPLSQLLKVLLCLIAHLHIHLCVAEIPPWWQKQGTRGHNSVVWVSADTLTYTCLLCSGSFPAAYARNPLSPSVVRMSADTFVLQKAVWGHSI